MRLLITALICLFVAAGCARKEKDYDRPLAPGALALQELDPSEWPRFSTAEADRRDLITAIDHSLDYLKIKSVAQYFPVSGVSQEQVQRGLEQFRALLLSGASDSEINQALKRDFRVFRSVGWDGSGEVLFTGYYTPIFEARLEPDSRFRYPVYKRPADLISGKTGKEIAQQKMPDGSTRPYPTWRELKQSGAFRGQEFVWFADAFDAYIVVVQGSAKLRMADGSLMEIGYAGTNGHQYHSVGRDLVADGKLKDSELNLANLRKFFRENPQMVSEYLQRNPRIVFFQPAPGGPFGSLGKPVTDNVSIATDKQIFPRGALTYVTTHSPDRFGRIAPYASFRVDQDTGGAISAPGRCDLYMGVGDLAERRAGHQLAEGFLYYIIAK